MNIRQFVGIAAISLLPMGCCCPPLMMCGPPGPPACYAPVSPFGRFPGPVHPTAGGPIAGYGPMVQAPVVPQAAGLPAPRQRVARRWPITAGYLADKKADQRFKEQKRIRHCKCEKCRNRNRRTGRGYLQDDFCGAGCDDCQDCLSDTSHGYGEVCGACTSSGCDCVDGGRFDGSGVVNSYPMETQTADCPCNSGGSSVQYYDQSVDSGGNSGFSEVVPQHYGGDSVPRPLPPPAPPEVPPMSDPMPMGNDGMMDLESGNSIQTMSLNIPTLDFEKIPHQSSDIELAVAESVVELQKPIEVSTQMSDVELIDDTFERVTIPPTTVIRKRVE